MESLAKSKRIALLTYASTFVFLLVLAWAAYSVFREMKNPARDGYLLLGMAALIIAALLACVYVTLNAIVANRSHSVAVRNATITAKYLLILNVILGVALLAAGLLAHD
jgi:hypothetical protein